MNLRLPILSYHSIADDGPSALAPFRVSPRLFARQIGWLSERGYHAISLPDWGLSIATRHFVPGRPIVITFDDGYADFLANAWPILMAANLRATLFVVTGKVGGAADWEPGSEPGLPLMGWDDLRQLQQEGNTIASHGAAHRVLTKLGDGEVTADGIAARAALRRELGVEATCVSYPWGRSDARVRRLLAGAGYRVGVGVRPQASTLDDDAMDLPRIEIYADDDLDGFARKVEAAGDRSPPVTVGAGPARQRSLAALSGRIDRLIDELAAIKRELADEMREAEALDAKLQALFRRPAAAPAAEILTPHQQISAGVRIGFEPTAAVEMAVLPKADRSLSPDACPNRLRFSFTGVSRWFTLDVALDWSELANAERFQLGVSLQASREAGVRAGLRLWQKDNQYHEVRLADFRLRPDERSYNLSGRLALPDPLACDHNSDPLFVLLFDTEAPLTLDLAFLNLYFV